MQHRRHLAITVLLAAVALQGAIAGEAGRIVAVGDVHGSFEGLTAILEETGIINDKLRWTGGTATYVQLGDLFDRGLEVREVVDLVMRLEREAAAAGGRVECIVGNHEMMNLTGFYRDANPDVFSTFADARSDKRRKKLWSAVKSYRGLTGEPVDEAAMQTWMTEHPLGWVEYAEALAPGGRYGAWLRGLPVAVLIDGVLFVHGGVGPPLAGATVESVNRTAADELATFDRARQYLVSKSIVPPTASIVEVGYAVHAILLEAEKEDSTDLVRRHADQLRELAEIDDWSIMSPEGPLWFRGPSRWDEAERGAEMAALLDGIGARVMVVGHTPDPEGRIRARFSNRVVIIDTGMLSSYYEGGQASALEIEDGVFTAVYLSGEREVVIGDDALDRAAALIPTAEVAADRAAATR
jgi:hypothetical protein